MKLQSLAKTASMLIALLALATISMTAQTYTTLLNFQGTNGQQPQSVLVQGTDGNLYGTTVVGGANGYGTIFRMTPAGKLTTIYNFCSLTACNDGSGPGQLILGNDGNFYGVTASGGTNCKDLADTGCGTVFKITPGGTFTTLYNFCSLANCADGWSPGAALVQGTDGNFYGITGAGGPYNWPEGTGEVFKLTPAGELTVLYGFCPDTNTCANGEEPQGLMQASNGSFYGTTDAGGANDCGTIYELTSAGAITTLYSPVPNQGCSHNGVIQASDGNFYGTTADGGGAHRMGSVYRLTPSGDYSILYGFCALAKCADGEVAIGPLVQGTDGNLYGVTRGILGANPTDGTIFQITTGGALTTLHSFGTTGGSWPSAGLVQATNGTFYGTTAYGGVAKCRSTCGTVFSISTGLGPFVEASPNYGAAGKVVKILGNNLTGTSSVTFNGVSATFTVVSGTYIKAQVPTGATNGTIEVTTPSGTLSSNAAFQVLP